MILKAVSICALALSVSTAAWATTHPATAPIVDPVYSRLSQALDELDGQAAGSPVMDIAGASLKPGDIDARVPLIRDRLAALGYGTTSPVASSVSDTGASALAEPTPSAPSEQIYDAQLEENVEALQRAWGLGDDGVVGRSTMWALNFGPEDARSAIVKTLARYSPPPAEGKSILVNIPLAEVIAFESGKEVMRSRVIVGTPETQTPRMTSRLTAVKYNPDWTVPSGLTEKYRKLLLAGRYDEVRRIGVKVKGPENTLYDVADVSPYSIGYDGLRFWQPPGDDNALGLLKFELDNTRSIYLHDTPKKGLFARDNRALSNGCVRVERYLEFAAWVLDTTTEEVQARIDAGNTSFARVPTPVTVQMAYYTAYPDELGGIRYGRDVYGLD